MCSRSTQYPVLSWILTLRQGWGTNGHGGGAGQGEALAAEYATGQREFTSRDFSGIRLSEQSLRGSVFSDCDFRDCIIALAEFDDCRFINCRFQGVNAIRASFARAEFHACKVRKAAFAEADFFEAVFSRSQFGGNFREAFFVGAKFLHAVFLGAVFEEAVFGYNEFVETGLFATTFNGFKLLGVNTIDSTTVANAFMVNVATLRASARQPNPEEREIAEVESVRAIRGLAKFFVASGVAVRTVRSYLDGNLFEAPLAYPDVFVSYSAQDTAIASEICSRLDSRGIDAWFAPHDLRGGRTVLEQLTEEIEKRAGVILILSEASMASSWVATEILRALQVEQEVGRRTLFPIRVTSEESVRAWRMVDVDGGRSVAHAIRRYRIPDFSPERTAAEWDQAFAMLFEDLHAVDSRPKRRDTPPQSIDPRDREAIDRFRAADADAQAYVEGTFRAMGFGDWTDRRPD